MFSGARVDLVLVDARVRLVVADIAVRSSSFRAVTVYVPNDQTLRAVFSRRLGSFLVDPPRLVTLDPKTGS